MTGKSSLDKIKLDKTYVLAYDKVKWKKVYFGYKS